MEIDFLYQMEKRKLLHLVMIIDKYMMKIEFLRDGFRE